jgi:hypothetical protein
VPQLQRGLIAPPEVLPTPDARPHAGPPDPIDEQTQALEARRGLADKEKAKLLQRQRR